MKQFFLLLLVCYSSTLFAQSPFVSKPPLDTSVFDKWPSVRHPAISHNGQYVLYTIYNLPLYSHTLVIRPIHGSWQKEFPGAAQASFSDNSRRVLFIRGTDSLCLLDLRTGHEQYITPVGAFRLFKQGKHEWIAYQVNAPERQLVLHNLENDKKRVFTSVVDYLLNEDGTVLVFITETLKGNIKVQALNRVVLNKGRAKAVKMIWQGASVTDLTFDGTGAQLAFIVTNRRRSRPAGAIWYYHAGAGQAVLLANDQQPDVDSNLQIGRLVRFSLDGKRLLFTLKERTYPAPGPGAVPVDIWSYTDARLQSRQLIQEAQGYGGYYAGAHSYMAVVPIKGSSMIRLQQRDEEIWPVSNGINDDWALITYRKADPAEESWNRAAQPSYYLLSMRTGQRKTVNIPFASLSPESKYLVGDDGQGNFFTYELATGKIQDITALIPAPPGDAGYDKPYLQHHRGLGFWGHWLPADGGILLYDRYDIWLVDPQGIKAPVNITSGYGRRNNITFRPIAAEGTIFKWNDRLILDAFDNRNKHNGFYSIVLGKAQAPLLLTMGPYVYYAKDHFYLDGEPPLRARDVPAYIVRRNSATESANYYYTGDFRHFTPLSEVYPERGYNWLRSELKTFTTLDGYEEQGILYKPENFDPGKKYPVIVHYYETMSERLYQYITPGFSAGDINIPYFVSRGYLVFTPDIRYTTGAPGASAYNAIIGAGKYLARLPWVDSCRMGITGRSFAGFETNYVITHSNMFAAACSDAGVADLVSGFGTIEWNAGFSLQDLYTRSYYRMGVVPWQSPDVYIGNSPIFRVDRVTTPVLLVHNKADAIVHFAQGTAFFTALRRLGKKVWMLQYDGEGHSLLQRQHQADLTIRITQFFDYYLKGAPSPVWMINGTPAIQKGKDNGLEYDQ